MTGVFGTTPMIPCCNSRVTDPLRAEFNIVKLINRNLGQFHKITPPPHHQPGLSDRIIHPDNQPVLARSNTVERNVARVDDELPRQPGRAGVSPIQGGAVVGRIGAILAGSR